MHDPHVQTPPDKIWNTCVKEMFPNKPGNDGNMSGYVTV